MLEIITIWLLVENTSISCWHQVKSYYIDLNVTQSVAIKHFFYSPFILFNANHDRFRTFARHFYYHKQSKNLATFINIKTLETYIICLHLVCYKCSNPSFMYSYNIWRVPSDMYVDYNNNNDEQHYFILKKHEKLKLLCRIYINTNKYKFFKI